MDTHTKQLMFSSKESNWETPQDFFDKLDDHYKFDLDPCATRETAKCEDYYTEEDDGLSKEWGRNRRVFVNPPYGKDIKKWIQKAYDESRKGNIVVMLIPSRTDTSYWHEYCMKASEIYFIKGRLKFGGATSGAPFPSAVVVFNGYYRGLTPMMMSISR
jgi:site-specific DNA-methyltransferase (adenine-specific)